MPKYEYLFVKDKIFDTTLDSSSNPNKRRDKQILERLAEERVYNFDELISILETAHCYLETDITHLNLRNLGLPFTISQLPVQYEWYPKALKDRYIKIGVARAVEI
ncbi:MAG: hypothetical protein M1165_02320 [Candidatus Pacearchaeota archaeon]|nr:hypothetical protein [Candidatus Pacearchaeota archaeon]MDE1848983.1 hypothetical protein [Nanoarchaeota archaeon]